MGTSDPSELPLCGHVRNPLCPAMSSKPYRAVTSGIQNVDRSASNTIHARRQTQRSRRVLSRRVSPALRIGARVRAHHDTDINTLTAARFPKRRYVPSFESQPGYRLLLYRRRMCTEAKLRAA